MITIWHNPRCSKSRQTLALIEERGDISIRKYLEDAPSQADIEAALSALQIRPIDMMRSKDALFKDLGLSKDSPDAALIAAMGDHPALIERPIVFVNGKARIGRPPEAVLEIL